MEQPQIYIHFEQLGPRVQFVADYFSERLGVTVKAIADKHDLAADAVVVNYVKAEGFSVPSSALLYESGKAAKVPDLAEVEGMPVLFPSAEKNFTIPFDIFSAVFWMLSRYEEYGSVERDAHDRFPAAQSLAAKADFLKLPVVDLWIELFKKKFTKHFPQIRFKEEKFSVQYTFDIDQAYCYAGKSFFRSIGGLAKQLTIGQISDALTRVAVKSSMRDDPFDVFRFIEETHREQQQPIIFWQVGPHGQYDKNLPVFHPMMLNILAKTKKFTKPALHPSYEAANDSEEISRQKQILQGAAEVSIEQSRQHYIRLLLPQTYRALLEAGIDADYSMGYPDAVGFRAGTAHTFRWYDLERDEQTTLRLHPFYVMDVTLRHYLKLSPQEAIEKVHKLIDSVRHVNGTFIPVWHNESLSGYGTWKGWRCVYEDMVQYLGSTNGN